MKTKQPEVQYRRGLRRPRLDEVQPEQGIDMNDRAEDVGAAIGDPFEPLRGRVQ